tara:strand:- start:44 stop:220 length:177 start_codon:yes stop_codon:yes gene_type:complete
MIATKKNLNFPAWIQIFAFGKCVEEVEGRAKALRLAKQIARDNKLNSVLHLGEIVRVL